MSSETQRHWIDWLHARRGNATLDWPKSGSLAITRSWGYRPGLKDTRNESMITALIDLILGVNILSLGLWAC